MAERTQRPTMEQVLLDIAAVMAARSTCSRGQVGAVIARDGRILSSGYNGAPAGMKHCLHPPGEYAADDGTAAAGCATTSRCTTSVHAEANAIAFAARHGVALDDAALYCTLAPCVCCAQLIINAGLAGVVYGAAYHDPAGVNLLREAGLFAESLDELTSGRPAVAHEPSGGVTPTMTSTIMTGVRAFAQSEEPRVQPAGASRSWLVTEARRVAARLNAAFPGRSQREAQNQQVLALAEEAGEFVGAYRRWSGQARRSGPVSAVELELADVVITAYITSDVLQFDLDARVAEKLAIIHSRPLREE